MSHPDVPTHDRLYVGGAWRAPVDGTAPVDVVSPHDRSVVGRAVQAAPADVDRAVAAARAAFDHGPWPRTAPAERIALLRRLNALREERAEEVATTITTENGSPLWFTRAGQTGLTRQADAYLKAAEGFGWEEAVAPSDPTLPFRTLVRREPVGVVAAVIPWNSPFSAALAKVIPALLAGNTVVLKVSPENSLSTHLLAGMIDRLGLPEGVVSVLPADRETSEHLVSHPGVDKISFTGSTRAGRRIGSIAGAHLKRVSLELGGKSAAIVLDDADPEAVLRGLPFSSLANNGQACVAQTRILVPRRRRAQWAEAIGEAVAALPVGDPRDPATFFGPLIRPDQQQRVRDLIAGGIAAGARAVTGGPGIPEGLEGGNYVTPTVLTDLDNSFRIAREEVFGPVLVVIPFDDDADAVRIADDSPYGLSGGVWSADEERALSVARRVRTGTVTVNGAPISFDGPFGGFRDSGPGREYGAAGLATYVEMKTITV